MCAGVVDEVTQCREKNTCANSRESHERHFRWQGDLTRHRYFHNVSSSSPIIVADIVGSLQGAAAHPRQAVTYVQYLVIEGEANAQIVKVLPGG